MFKIDWECTSGHENKNNHKWICTRDVEAEAPEADIVHESKSGSGKRVGEADAG